MNKQKQKLSLSFGEAGAVADELEQFIRYQRHDKIQKGLSHKDEYMIQLALAAKPDNQEILEAAETLKTPWQELFKKYPGRREGNDKNDEAERTLSNAAHGLLAGKKSDKDLHLKTQLRIQIACKVLEEKGFSELNWNGITKEQVAAYKNAEVRKPSVRQYFKDNFNAKFPEDNAMQQQAKGNLAGAESIRDNANEHRTFSAVGNIIPDLQGRKWCKSMRAW